MAQDGNLPKCGKCGRPMRTKGADLCYACRVRRHCYVCRKYSLSGTCAACREVLRDLQTAHSLGSGPSVPRVLLRIVKMREVLR